MFKLIKKLIIKMNKNLIKIKKMIKTNKMIIL